MRKNRPEGSTFSILPTVGTMSIAEITASSPCNDREEGTENQKYPCRKCQCCPNTCLETRKDNGHYRRTNEKRQDCHANLRRGRPRSVSQIPPKSSLVLHSVGKDDIALPRFKVLQPPILLMTVSHIRAEESSATGL